MKKRGIALIYNPHTLLQFIWYYSTHAGGVEWDALCIPHGTRDEYMSPYCEKTGIFGSVIKSDVSFFDLSFSKQMKMFMGMFGHFITGRRVLYCERLLSGLIDYRKYDIFAVLCDFGVVSGAMTNLGGEKEVVILEDGAADYVPRSFGNILKRPFSAGEWISFWLARMSYANPGMYYPMKSTGLCVKYSSHPETMSYRNYRRVDRLFDFEKTDFELYNKIVEKTYGKPDTERIKNSDTVLFTTALGDFTDNDTAYIKKLVDYVSKNSDNILLKKHPRDESVYNFGKSVVVGEADTKIPAELLLPYIRNKRIIFAYPTSIMLHMRSEDYRVEAVYFNGLSEECLKKRSYKTVPYLDREAWVNEFKKFSINDVKLIDL